MAAVEPLTEEEAYLWAILSDPSGLDQAEFSWFNAEDEETNCFRAWPFQWKWWRDITSQQIDQCGRSVGKSLSIKVRSFAFPFIHPGQEMVITAPEGNHLDAVTDVVETAFVNTRLGREMIMKSRSGIKHRPFHMNFANGSRIMGRIPQRDGKGVKGIHPIWLELDEAQDYPKDGWIEIFETLKQGHDGAVWRAHGVTRGVRDFFHDFTKPDSGWQVHRYCLPGDTLVYGVNGPVPISDVQIGDPVWSINKDGQLIQENVTDTLKNGVKRIWEVKTKGGYSLRSTGNHPYLRMSNVGTRKTRRNLAFEWVDAEALVEGDYIVCARDLPGPSSPGNVPSSAISSMLESYSINREVPSHVWAATKETKLAFLAGYLMGDGSRAKQKKGQDPWQIGTGSLVMAKQLKALAHYCGLRCTNIESHNPEGGLSDNPQYRFYIYPNVSWFKQIPNTYSVHDIPLGEEFVVRRVASVMDTGRYEETFDITVGEHHNFIAEGVVVHNTAMHRPTWSDEIRQKQIAKYGSADHPDYRRNVLGLHGDATNPLFVLHRLMACFLGDTNVLTPEGERFIKDLQVGDSVYNFLDESEILAVNTTERDEIYEVVVNGKPTYCTAEHPFFTDRGWVHADRLEPGDRIYTQEEILRMVQQADPPDPKQAVLLQVLYADLAWTNLSGFNHKETNVQRL